MAWMLRYRSNLRTAVKCQKSGSIVPNKETKLELITVEEMENAEWEILKHVQKESFKEEIATLRKACDGIADGTRKRHIKKSSKIFKLDQRLVDGLIRVGGRLANASLQQEAKHPVILPKSHHVVHLIVRYYHYISGHSGAEHVLSLARERFWIVGARVTVRKSLNTCFDCRRRQAPVGEQKMADLPKDRITPDKPPFSFVGVDCFGPFIVRRGRSMVKRYGVLYTCLTVRAIHIAVVHSLDTDCFINSMRRFIARRGSRSR